MRPCLSPGVWCSSSHLCFSNSTVLRCGTQPLGSTAKCPITTTAKAQTGEEEEYPPAQSVDHDFSCWASSAGVKMSSLLLTLYGDGSRGLSSAKAIRKGASLVSVPAASVVQVTSTGSEAIPPAFDKARWKMLPWFARLALLILSIRNEQPDHPLRPWLSSKLPVHALDPPYRWTNLQIAQLQNPVLQSSVLDQRQAYTSYYVKASATVAEKESGKRIDKEQFLSLIDCVRSRAFSGPLETAPFKDRLRLASFVLGNTVAWPLLQVLPWENAFNGGLTAMFSLMMFDLILPKIQKVITGFGPTRYAVVPGIDMFNHDSLHGRNSNIEYQYFTNTFDVRSSKDYGPDEQVYISYGNQSNDSLLQYYSFVEDGNPHDSFVFDDEVTVQLGFRKGELKAIWAGFTQSTVQQVVRRLGNNVGRHEVQQILREMCAAQLNRFQTTMEQDESLLASITDVDTELDIDTKRLKLAIRYRLNKKRLLQNVIDTWEVGKTV